MLHLEVLFHNTIGGIRNKVHDNIEIDLLWLVSIRVEGLPHLYTIRMVKHLQDLQFSVLIALVLEHFLDGYRLTSFRNRRLKHHSKRPIADNFLSVVSKTLLLTNNVISGQTKVSKK